MYRTYEIHEVLTDGTSQMVDVVAGLEFAKIALQGLAKRTKNECFAADVKTRQIVMQMNVPRPKLQEVKHVFQIAYDEQRGHHRAELLKARGYAVFSVIGNAAAKVALSTMQELDFFIVGHAAPEEDRREMVHWLKIHYPSVKILALNPPGQQIFSANYNVREDDPESWVQVVIQKLENSATDPAARRAAR